MHGCYCPLFTDCLQSASGRPIDAANQIPDCLQTASGQLSEWPKIGSRNRYLLLRIRAAPALS